MLHQDCIYLHNEIILFDFYISFCTLIGFLNKSSLPIGGESTNTVIAGHTGYIGRIFFDNIFKLQIGDEVSLTNYWYTMTYKVVEKEIYAPNQSQAVFINDDRDLLTMLTCISDGKGEFDRYYVICERIN